MLQEQIGPQGLQRLEPGMALCSRPAPVLASSFVKQRKVGAGVKGPDELMVAVPRLSLESINILD